MINVAVGGFSSEMATGIGHVQKKGDSNHAFCAILLRETSVSVPLLGKTCSHFRPLRFAVQVLEPFLEPGPSVSNDFPMEN